MRSMHLIRVRGAIDREYAERPGKRRDEKALVRVRDAPRDQARVEGEPSEVGCEEQEEPDKGGNVCDLTYRVKFSYICTTFP